MFAVTKFPLSCVVLTTIIAFNARLCAGIFKNNDSLICQKCNCTDLGQTIQCTNVPLAEILQVSDQIQQWIKNLHIFQARIPSLDLNFLQNFSQLETFSVDACGVQNVAFNPRGANLPLLTEFSLPNNKIRDFSSISDLFNNTLSHVKLLNLHNNQLRCESEHDCLSLNSDRLQILDLSKNSLNRLPKLPKSLKIFNVSSNYLRHFPQRDLESLRYLDLSFNLFQEISELDFRNLKNVETLNISHNSIKSLEPSFMSELTSLKNFDASFNPLRDISDFPRNNEIEHISLAYSEFGYLNFTKFQSLGSLKTLDVSNNLNLEFMYGKAGDFQELVDFRISKSAFRSLPLNFFHIFPALRHFDASHNPWACDCRLKWLQLASTNLQSENQDYFNSSLCAVPQSFQNQRILSINQENFTECHLGIASHVDLSRIVVNYGSDTKIRCEQYGDPPASVRWDQVYPSGYIGAWDAESNSVIGISMPEKFQILPGGTLQLLYADRSTVSRYVCTAYNSYGNVSATIIFRLHADWTNMKIYSIFCGIGTALAFFALNVIWAGIRSLIIWRLARMERTSRIRKMLEAMEKYRQKQAEGLQEKYTSKMNAIRENYHMQAELLRRSYTCQAERFRDYKAQQMDVVSSHVEAARDGYASQMARMRDYGSKQMERVFESYQRQMNKVRTFSLQQRLRLMRQYKIKHRYLNKLLEGLNMASVRDPVADVEMMTLPRLEEEMEDPLGLGAFFPRAEDTISISTYHSLPNEDEELAIALRTLDMSIEDGHYDAAMDPDIPGTSSQLIGSADICVQIDSPIPYHDDIETDKKI